MNLSDHDAAVIVMMLTTFVLVIVVQRRWRAARAQYSDDLLYREMFDRSAEGIIITDADSRIVRINGAFADMVGYSSTELLGLDPEFLTADVQTTSQCDNIRHGLAIHDQWSGEVWCRRKSGDTYPAWLAASVLRGPNGRIKHYIGYLADISHTRIGTVRLQRKLYHDALTGLPNRLLLRDRLEMAIANAKRKGRKLAVVFIDLDHFKLVNDRYGHAIGDKLLVAVTERMATHIRESDTLSRQGGDEFILLLPDTERESDVEHTAERLVGSVTRPFLIDGHSLTIGASAGFALYPDDGQAIDQLLIKADLAMYAVKRSGRGRIRRYDPDTMNGAHLLRRTVSSEDGIEPAP